MTKYYETETKNRDEQIVLADNKFNSWFSIWVLYRPIIL